MPCLQIREIVARRYETGEPVRISVRDERIRAVVPAWPNSPVETLPWVAPGLFDLQVNGYGGIWFSSPSVTSGEVAGAIRHYLSHGVTRILPTVITNSHEALKHGLQSIANACRDDDVVNSMVAGCHLEGPWISPFEGPRGAHPQEHVRPADWNEFQVLQRASGGKIRLVTIAPEVPGAIGFIRQAVASGVRIAIGHTAASTAQLNDAVEAGATLSTHLGNGCHPLLPRHPNPIWDQLGNPLLAASIITDGHHLPAGVVRSIIAAKGSHNTIITCDASGWAGCQPGAYSTVGHPVEIQSSGRIVVAGQDAILAGSSATTEVCVGRATALGGISLRTAIDMACRNPCRLLGFSEYRLMSGDMANLFLYRTSGNPQEECSIEVVATILQGQLVWGDIPSPGSANR
jgi:N-acetylglucosamine-6-phosphate deacetylase